MIDDYSKIEYAILKELYECKKENLRVDLSAISPERFHITDGYLLDIIEALLEEGYIKGPLITMSKTGRAVSRMYDIDITREGIRYLNENATMKKVYEAMKEVRDWFPIF